MLGSIVLLDPARATPRHTLVALAVAFVIPVIAYLVMLRWPYWPTAYWIIHVEVVTVFGAVGYFGSDPIFFVCLAVVYPVNALTVGGVPFFLYNAPFALLGAALGVWASPTGALEAPEPSRALAALVLVTYSWVAGRTSHGALMAVKHKRAEVRRQRLRLQNAASRLSKYLSPQLVRRIFEQASPGSQHAERKDLTVCFTDICGFTTATEAAEPLATADFLNSYLQQMQEIALAHGATIDKTIGDALMLFFGDPESDGEAADAIRCCLMALEMQGVVESGGAAWQGQFGFQNLRIRIGINSGTCIVGNFGSADRLDYTAVGHHVNVASRLEGVATPGAVLISEATYELVRGTMVCRPVGELNLKGIRAGVRAYELLEARSVPET